MNIETLGDLFRELDSGLALDEMAAIAKLDEKDLFTLHVGLGARIRALVYYHNDSEKGKEKFVRLGMPDDGSSVLSALYWVHLSGQPFSEQRIEGVIESKGLFVDPGVAKAMALQLSREYEAYRGSNAA